MAERDPFTSLHWNGLIRVVIHPPPVRSGLPSIDELARRFFGRPLQLDEWGWLVGAPDGAALDVTSERGDGGPIVQIRVDHSWYDGPSFRLVYADDAGRTAIRNEYLRVRDDAPPGIGTRVLAHQVRAACALDISFLTAEAAGGPGSPTVGYDVWPRLGFNGLLPDAVRRRLPARFADATDVLDLLRRPGGRDWWWRNGRAFEASFDLADGSLSLATLTAYTASRDIRI
jgi:hypothetical protein